MDQNIIATETADWIINEIASIAAKRGDYSDLISPATTSQRQAIEESLDRHAARQRAQGLAGW